MPKLTWYPINRLVRRAPQGASLLLTLGCLFAATPSLADEAGWRRWENKAFVAYGDGAGDDVLKILHELEYIRAAAEQTPSFVIPEGRPRTLVLLPATRDEFAALTPFDTTAGFAQPLDGRAVIVMPSSGAGDDALAVIRHEFAHTMLFNDWFDYPTWYAEGFAEIMSAIEIDRRGNAYSIGNRPRHYGRLRPAVDWRTLVSKDFNPHALADQDRIQAAYAQTWVLVHYLTLGGDPQNANALNRYFAELNSGEASAAAFEEAFGTGAGALWEDKLRDYARHPPATRHEFDDTYLDLDFSVTETAPDEVAPLVRFFRDQASARRPGPVTGGSIDVVNGRWDSLKLDGQCSEPLAISLEDDGDVVRIDGFYSADGQPPIPALFVHRPTDDGNYLLVNVTAKSYPQVLVAADYKLSIRSDSVICLDRVAAARPCSSVLQRCDSPTR